MRTKWMTPNEKNHRALSKTLPMTFFAKVVKA